MVTKKLGKHKLKSKNQAGYSLLEVLVVLVIFSLLAVVSSTAILLAIRGARKSDASARVRGSLDFAIATIERQVRNASSITNCDGGQIDFEDGEYNPASFSCQNIGQADGYVASGSARLTGEDVTVTSCVFTCTTSQGSNPPSVTIDLSAKDRNTAGAEGASFNVSTQVVLRTY